VQLNVDPGAVVDADLNTVATALCVGTDDLLKGAPDRLPRRPRVGIAPRISDAEVVTLGMMQVLLGFTSEAMWLRFAGTRPQHLLGYVPQQPGYNKRLRRLAGTLDWLIRVLARDTRVFTDDVWLVDSTPGRVRPLPRDSALFGSGRLGRIRLLREPLPLPTGAKADERQVLLDLLHTYPTLTAARPGQTLIAD